MDLIISFPSTPSTFLYPGITHTFSPFAYHIEIRLLGALMNQCSSLYFLSAIACQLSECLSENELAILSTDLSTLGDMLESILARRAACEEQSPLSPAQPK